MTAATLASAFPIASGTEITPELRPAWLECRRLGLGASEVADVCGLGRRSPLDVYLRKLGLAPPVEETEAMRIGTLSEPIIRELFERRTGRRVAREQVFLHDAGRLPRCFATVDAVCEDGGIVEWKTVGLRTARDWGDDGTDEVPEGYGLQVTAQMLLAGATEATVAALMGTELRVYRVGLLSGVARFVRDKAARFLDRLDRGVPPDPSRPEDAALVPLLHPDAAGEVALDGEAAGWAASFLDRSAEAASLEKLRKTLKAKLDLALAGAEYATLPDGRRLRRRVQVQEESVVTTTRKASSWSVITEVKVRKGDRDGDGE